MLLTRTQIETKPKVPLKAACRSKAIAISMIIWLMLCTMTALMVTVTGSPAQASTLRNTNNKQHLLETGKTSTNTSVEDRMWKIAASCLRSHFGPQFLANKDVKCASSQVVLTLSRMQRAACKSCESYFHCRAFATVQVRCRDNYDVHRTIEVIRGCRALYQMGNDEDNTRAINDALRGIECSKVYLCRANCRYNPADATCPRNNCPMSAQQQQQSRPPRLTLANNATADNDANDRHLYLKNNIRGNNKSSWSVLSNKALPEDSPHKPNTNNNSKINNNP